MLLPGIFASLSLAIPPRARSIGFSVASLWVIPGLAVLPVIGCVGDRFGLRGGMLLMVPVFLVGGLVIASTEDTIADDIADVWRRRAPAREVAYERRQGRSKLLLVRDLDVAYGDVQVLFGVDLEVEEGEMRRAARHERRRQVDAAEGHLRRRRGRPRRGHLRRPRDHPRPAATRSPRSASSQMPGGQGVFPTLTVAENLRTATWLAPPRPRRGRAWSRCARAVPGPPERADDRAGDLSGGQQQMLGLGDGVPLAVPAC